MSETAWCLPNTKLFSKLCVRCDLGQLGSHGMIRAAPCPHIFRNVADLQRVRPCAPISTRSADADDAEQQSLVGQLAYGTIDGHPRGLDLAAS
ncbi:MAG: hypothetical protein U5K38_04180 [Woeseiaceae bacterium]|nr:hypothetical protein [Woeseiaceae bacterium]